VHIEGNSNDLPVKILQVSHALSRWPNSIDRLTMFDTMFHASWSTPSHSLPQFAYG
jgi:hypothetical protein